jgi:hypothetical protein
MNECEVVSEMMRDPARSMLVIDPEEEYRRFREWLASDEGQAFVESARDDRNQAYRDHFEAKIDRERDRWGSRKLADPLPTD